MIVENGTIKNGVVFLFVPGSTAALTTIEYEPGLIADLPSMLERVAPRDGAYEHEKRWHDGNWQQIVFIEFDVRPRDRPFHGRIDDSHTPLFPMENTCS